MFGALNNSIVGSHSEREWRDLVIAWGWRCFYCANPIYEKAEDPERELTKDHLVPTCRGGVDFIWNIVPACYRCNRLKGSLKSEEFQIARPALVERGSENRTGKDSLCSVPQPVITPFAQQAVNYLAPKMSMNPADDPAFWQQRRTLLRQQASSISRRFLEFAGQMQLSLDLPSSVKKTVEAEAAALTVAKGLDVAPGLAGKSRA